MSKRKENMQSNDGSYVVTHSKKMNVFAFIVCLLLAFCIWVYVMNMENGDYMKSFTLFIEVVGEDQLYEKTGLRVFDDSAMATMANVTVQGTKADVQKYREQDFRAYIDVSDLKEPGKTTVGINVETPNSSVKVFSTDPMTVKVYVDYEETKTVRVAVETKGTNITDYTLDYPTVEISGPADFVNQVETAKVQLDTKNYDVGDEMAIDNIRLYGEKNNLLSNLNLTVQPETVTVTVNQVEKKDA